MNPPRIAVLGCGYWGQNLVRNFHELGVLQVVCDTAPTGRARAAELAPTARIAESISETLADPDIDAVAISTPAETHHALTIEALRHGKDVLVEKPLAVNYRQGI